MYKRQVKLRVTGDFDPVIRAIGAEYVPADDVPVERLRQTLGAIDVVYEAVGASSLAFQAIHQLGPNGVFVFTGVPGRKAPIAVDTDRLMRDLVLKNQVMLGTVNAGKDAFDAAIRDLGQFMIRWPDAVRRLITRHPVADFRALRAFGAARRFFSAGRTSVGRVQVAARLERVASHAAIRLSSK